MFPIIMLQVLRNKGSGIHSVYLMIPVKVKTDLFQSKLFFHVSIIVEYKFIIISKGKSFHKYFEMWPIRRSVFICTSENAVPIGCRK